ncbi:PfaB family protein [Shewanella salipaludis]|uniref:PfaB family protein n=1 Tax=Shewanella salipaludis TaxID=2723052 RepID=A0A972FWK0_9GAMM|nr:PfaB family protein [Shewanella salipaludis]NMH64588.1 PfaB family protein [Shewanella salipaludis]
MVNGAEPSGPDSGSGPSSDIGALRIAVLLGDEADLLSASSPLAGLEWVHLSLEHQSHEPLTQLLDRAAELLSQGKPVVLSAKGGDENLRLYLLDGLTAAKRRLHVHCYLAGWASGMDCEFEAEGEVEAREKIQASALARAKRSAAQAQLHNSVANTLWDEFAALYRAVQALARRSLAPLAALDATATKPCYWFSRQHQARVLCLNLKRPNLKRLNLTANTGNAVQSVVLTQGSRLAAPRPLLDESRLFIPLGGSNIAELQTHLADLSAWLDALNSKAEAEAEPDTAANALQLKSQLLKSLVAKSLRDYDPWAPLALVLMAQSGTALAQEVLAMQAALAADAVQFKTPAGSCFCARPLGDAGLTLVYPGVGTVYANMFSDLSEYFPDLYAMLEREGDLGAMLQAASLYHGDPETAAANTARMSLSQQAIAGVGASYLFTQLLTREFKLRPRFALGYSMGEAAMWASLGVWQAPHQLIEATENSSIFNRAISGELTAVRRAWQLRDDEPIIWNSFLVRADAAGLDQLRAALPAFPRAYLAITQGDSCVLAGCETSCRALLAHLGKRGIAANRVTAMHTPPAMAVHGELLDFYTLALNQTALEPEALEPEAAGIDFISAAEAGPVSIDSQSIARSIADTFCGPLDFGALIHRAHDLGARLFLEVGADRQTSTLIDKILKQDGSRPALALAGNAKGADTATSLLKCLAQLISHRVSLSLAPLLAGLAQGTSQSTSSGTRSGTRADTSNYRTAFSTQNPAAAPTPSAEGEPL